MGWTRLEPPPKGTGSRAAVGLRLTLRHTTRFGMTVRMRLGAALVARLADADEGWKVGGKIEACLGNGADRGSLRLMPADDGDFELRSAPGGRSNASPGLNLRLPQNVAWADEPGTWKLTPDDLQVSDMGALTVSLPESALSTKAHVIPNRRAA